MEVVLHVLTVDRPFLAYAGPVPDVVVGPRWAQAQWPDAIYVPKGSWLVLERLLKMYHYLYPNGRVERREL